MKKLSSRLIFLLGIAILVIAGAVYAFFTTDSQANEPAAVASALTIESSAHDFGTISMAAGKVSKVFTIKNDGATPVEIKKIYTSCMCTTAAFKVQGEVLGPFGMPGHGVVPPVNRELAPGATADIEVIFDPAAHGPSGVGRIARVVTIETNSGRSDLRISALVVP